VNPFELADYIGFAAALLAGIGVGRRMRPKPPKPLKPICTCGHGFGHHEDGRACKATNEDYWYEMGVRNYRVDQCKCRRYDGPDPAIFGLEVHP
jgi:hypothetical protein